jgi:hypothetical protein
VIANLGLDFWKENGVISLQTMVVASPFTTLKRIVPL